MTRLRTPLSTLLILATAGLLALGVGVFDRGTHGDEALGRVESGLSRSTGPAPKRSGPVGLPGTPASRDDLRLLLVAAAPAAFAPQDGDATPRTGRGTSSQEGSRAGRSRAAGQGPADETLRDFDRDCLRSGCHRELSRQAWTHAPVAVGSCDPCHVATGDPKLHRFRAARPKETACAFCHKAPAPDLAIHEPFAKHDCTGCHDPHGGATRALMKSTSEKEVCGECHDPTRQPTDDPKVPGAPWASLHKPITEGKCLSCHSPHQSAHKGLLARPQRTLCSECHQEVEQQVASAAHVHEPVTKECSACHLPHGGVHGGLLRERPKELCLSCHEDVAKSLSDPSQHVHGALDTDTSCLGCHRPHDGPTKALTLTELGKGCLECHDEELRTPDGRVVASITAEIQNAKSVHEPVTKGECQGCHKSHSSPLRALLAKDHPTEPYQAWSDAAFELCFSCHERTLVSLERSTTTGFRDGDRNLHYVHVNKEKGRSCNLCHATHGSSLEKLVRPSVSFGPGGWKLPLTFEATESGGSCGPGCHQALAYDRITPRVPVIPPDATDPPKTEDATTER